MNCHESKKLFSEAFDARLDQEALMRFRTHLQGCSSCADDYHDYANLFAAVAALPAVENDHPVPFPETARAFTRPAAAVSLGQRLVRIAALLLVLCGIGWMAFDAGRRDANLNEDDSQSVAALDPADIVLPDVSAQRQLRAIYDRARNYGTLVEVAPSYPDATVTRLVDHAGRELRSHCQELTTLAPQQLGTFSAELRRTAVNLDALCIEVGDILEAKEATSLRLHRSRELVRVRDLGHLMAPIRSFARSTPESELTEPQDGDVYSFAWAGIEQLGRRDAPRATLYFDRARTMPGFGQSQLNNMVQHFEFFIQQEVVGQGSPAQGQQLLPQGVLETLRRQFAAPSAVWITGSADRELRFSTNQNAEQPRTIIIRQIESGVQGSLSIKIGTRAPQPKPLPEPQPQQKQQI